MKIVYLAHARIPTEKAHGINMVQMCRAFASLGHDVSLVIPKRVNPITEDLFSYYGIEKRFGVTYLPVWSPKKTNRLTFWLSWLSFARSVLKQRRTLLDKDTIVFTRDELTGWLLAKRGYQVVYDMHGFPETSRRLWKTSMRGMDALVVTNNWKKEQCHNIFGIDEKKLFVAPNGFDPDLFTNLPSKEEARERVGLPKDTKIAMYTGHLFDWKGVHVMAAAAARASHVQFVFVGGRQKDVETFQEKYKQHSNIHVVGHVPHTDIPTYLSAADVLVLPNPTKAASARLAKFSTFDSSPIKLFEYMASGRPIVATAIPSIEEILHKGTASLVAPDDPDALAKGIQKVLDDSGYAALIAEEAKKVSQSYTWQKRATSILSFISSYGRK